MSRCRVGIVGGSGFVGSKLANHMAETFDVKVIDKRSLPTNLQNRVEFRRCDITQYDEVRQALKDVDLVIHTAIVQIPSINEARRLGYEVNFLGTQNICKVVDKTPSIRGMILTGTWHVFGEGELGGLIDEKLGYRPDKVQDRARLYVLSKIAQETIIRFYDEMSEKIYGVVRMGTVLGEGMPEKTAANIFISRGLRGEPITPFKHSMYRPMLYVDINDLCWAFEVFVTKILNGQIRKEENSLTHIFNLSWPNLITILELAHMIRDTVVRSSGGKVKPKIEIVDKGLPILYEVEKGRTEIDVSKALRVLGFKKLTSPQESIKRIVEGRLL